jgi:hypothetical protein
MDIYYIPKEIFVTSFQESFIKKFIGLFSLVIKVFWGLVKMCGGICGLVVRVPSYRSRGPGSIPGATRFSEE